MSHGSVSFPNSPRDWNSRRFLIHFLGAMLHAQREHAGNRHRSHQSIVTASVAMAPENSTLRVAGRNRPYINGSNQHASHSWRVIERRDGNLRFVWKFLGNRFPHCAGNLPSSIHSQPIVGICNSRIPVGGIDHRKRARAEPVNDLNNSETVSQ